MWGPSARAWRPERTKTRRPHPAWSATAARGGNRDRSGDYDSMSRIARAVFLSTVLSPVAVHLVLSAPIPDFVRRVPFAGATVSADALAAALAGAPRLLAERLMPGGEQSVWSFLRGLEPWQVELAVALAAAFLLSGFAVGANGSGGVGVIAFHDRKRAVISLDRVKS